MGLYRVELTDGAEFEVSLSPSGHVWNADVGERRLELRLLGACREAGLLIEIDGRRVCLSFDALSDEAFQRQLRAVEVSLPQQRKAAEAARTTARKVESPIAGIVLAIMARPGDHVKRGEPLFIVEAMKMENVVTAPCDGVFGGMQCSIGDVICKGQMMAEVAASHRRGTLPSPSPRKSERRLMPKVRPWLGVQAATA